jgi:hypothetical protein
MTQQVLKRTDPVSEGGKHETTKDLWVYEGIHERAKRGSAEDGIA